jgi:hypothetical protein
MKNLFKALSEFQNEVPIIHKGTQGYGYSYSDLPTIFPVINPLLKKHGLGFTQLGQGTSLKTLIFHIESGETIESIFDIPQGVQLSKMNDFQVLGSAITYMRRYALSSALGIITDKDTDAGGEQIKADIDKRILACKTQGDLTKLFSEVNPKDAATIEKFTKRKLELSKNN